MVRVDNSVRLAESCHFYAKEKTSLERIDNDYGRESFVEAGEFAGLQHSGSDTWSSIIVGTKREGMCCSYLPPIRSSSG